VFSVFILTVLAAATPSAADLRSLQADRNVGLAALEEGNLAEATRRFASVRRLAPSDPLGWADGAVAAMRARDLETAGRFLTEALRLSGGDPRVLALEGARRELAGDLGGAAEAFERAAAASPKDVASLWAAARIRSAGGAEDRRRAMADLDRALAEAPANVFLLVRLLELARQTDDSAAAASAHARLSRLVAGDARLDRALAEATAAADAGDAKAADLKYRIVENLLKATPRYQQSRRDVEPGVVGLPLEDWSEPLASAVRARAGEPIPVRYARRSEADAGLAGVAGAVAIRVAGRTARDLAFAGPWGLRIASAGAGGYRVGPPIPGSPGSRDVAVADVTNSGELDLVTPAALWSIAAGGAWKKSVLDPGEAEAGAESVVPFDVDADGDLDLYVSSRSSDRLLRNNLDGTFTNVTEAAGLPKGTSSRGAVAADLDRDGDVDLLLLAPSGGFVLYDNLRGGRLAPRESGLPRRGSVASAAAGDLDGDGRLDLVFSSDGAASAAENRGDGTFGEPSALGPADAVRLLDYDNDGFLDVLRLSGGSASSLQRNDGTGRFGEAAVGALPSASAAEAADFDGDGDLDLVFLGPKGASLYANEGGNANGWIDVALEGLPTGSAKVNRFGFGSDVELKAQELYVYRVAWRPVTRLGLGAKRRADVLRIVWTNGIPQNALDPGVRTVLREVQQLKGSCPFLYAFDGARWHFVTDVLGRAPAGLLYDGVHQAPADTREWMVVPAEMLQPRQGRLELDFTEELWETVYFDLAELWAVDRPAGVGLVPNEKMVPPPFPEKRLFTVANPRVPKAIDGEGRDRTAEISEEDGRFLGGFAPTRYQGIVEPHDLVLELPEARGARSVMLYLTGWLQYADTSINVSLSQRKDLAADGPVLEIPDGKGSWKTAIAPMGYPAGKTKTMPVDLSGVLDRTDPRVRIRTNLAIYWDRIVYTVDDPPVPTRLTAAPLVSAELTFRGFSRMTREHAEAPHLFVHDDVSTEPRWADMAGRYTRFGDVRPLLTDADDRYVVMKGGDAVRLVFDASPLPPLPAGWARDWLFVSDGWEKDADKNTVASQTIEPLPFHGMDDARYGELEFPDSPAHRDFVREYLTREGGPDEFRDAVRESRGPRVEGRE
jgi:tetratricopeptide (TPR) repeat protein